MLLHSTCSVTSDSDWFFSELVEKPQTFLTTYDPATTEEAGLAQISQTRKGFLVIPGSTNNSDEVTQPCHSFLGL